MEDDDDYDEQEDSEDNNFIANDEEVYEENERAKKREKRKLKKELQKKGIQEDSDANMLDEEDFELIKENRQQKRKLKKMNDTVPDSDDDKILQKKPVKKDMVEPDQKYIKNEDDKHRVNDLIKKQNFTHKRDQTTASDDEDKE